jgi:hypothetical protein
LCCFVYKTHAQTTINGVTSLTYIGGYHIKCNGQSTGTLNANPSFGAAPYTFLWNTGENTAQINNKPAGIYIVTMTDSLNNTDVDTFELKQPYPLDYQASLSDFYGYNIEAHGGENGFIQLLPNGGTPPYRYLWSNVDSASNRKDLSVGAYSFTITDANQCSTNGSITLTEPDPINISFSGVENPKCFKTEDGKATINITGGLGDFSVVWDNGSFSLNPEDLLNGFNAVRIYEHGKAVLDTGITLTSPDEIDVQFTYIDYNGFNVSCVDCFNGSITTTTSGGTAPYTYLWDDISNSATANLSNLNGGDYNLTVIDANGCETSHTVQLTMPTPKDWSRQGNANIDPAEFIGSTDTSAVVFKTNSQEAMRLMGNGNVELAGDLKLRSLASNSFGMLGLDIDGTLKPLTGTQISETVYKSLPCPTINTDGSVDSPPGWTALALGQKYFNGLNTCGKVGVNMPSGIAPSAELEVRGSGLIKNNLTVEQDFSLWGNAHTQGNSIIDGKLGIGVNAPNEKLEVNGNGLISGTLGIGTSTPRGKFEIKMDASDHISFGRMRTELSGWATSYIGINAYRVDGGIWKTTGDANNSGGAVMYANSFGDLMFTTINGSGTATEVITNDDGIKTGAKMILTNTGVLGIGVNPHNHSDLLNYKLVVEGKIRCRKLRVDLDSWADMVFEPSYDLMNLNELNTFIAKNKHLPDVPKESELKENGIDISEMQKIQMQKIEELVLYVIQLNKENEALKKRIELIEKSK